MWPCPSSPFPSMSTFTKVAVTDVILNRKLIPCNGTFNSCQLYQERGRWVKEEIMKIYTNCSHDSQWLSFVQHELSWDSRGGHWKIPCLIKSKLFSTSYTVWWCNKCRLVQQMDPGERFRFFFRFQHNLTIHSSMGPAIFLSENRICPYHCRYGQNTRVSVQRLPCFPPSSSSTAVSIAM